MEDDPEVQGAVARARAGDAEALGELFRRLGPRVLGLCRHMLRSPEAAEDARSEVFLRVQRRLGSYDPAQPFVRWLLAIAGHHCVDVLRRRRLEGRLFADQEIERVAGTLDGEPGATPLRQVLLDESRDALRAAIARLPESYRLPLVLRYHADLGYDEIAAQLGLKRNHVATLIFRAKHALRRALAAEDEGSR